MATIEQIPTSTDLRKGSERLNAHQQDKAEDGRRDLVLKWFTETQAVFLLCDGVLPSWFQGFFSRQEAEDRLRDKSIGCFLIRLSEKSIGYILSYRGQDRCRHFVINQNKDGQLVVTGDSTAHGNLQDLIQHFKTMPIQPFGEYLTSDHTEGPSDEVYDMVHSQSSVRSGVSVQALRSLWDQRGDVQTGGPSALVPKSRKLGPSSSVDRSLATQVIPPLPKKNIPLRSSLSASLTARSTTHDLEPRSAMDMRRPSGVGLVTWAEEQVYTRRGSHTRESSGFSSLDSHLGQVAQSSNQTHPPLNTLSHSLPSLDSTVAERRPQKLHLANSSPSALPHPPVVPPKSSSCTSFLMGLRDQRQLSVSGHAHTGLLTLQANPLYQVSGMGPQSQTEPSRVSGHPNRGGELMYAHIPRKPTHSDTPGPSDHQHSDTYQHMPGHDHGNTYEHLPEHHLSNTYEHIPEHQQSNAYEDLPEHQQSNTYEHLLERPHGNTYEHLPEHLRGNTYEPLPEHLHGNTYEHLPEHQQSTDYIMAQQSDTYESLEEISMGKKSHKWWRILQDKKK